MNKGPSTLAIGMLVTGNLVGAGILGLPINTGLAGFSITMVVMMILWAMMVTSALIIASHILKAKSDTFDLPALFGQTLGPVGKWLAVAANLLILYGFMVAYLAGGTQILDSLFNLPISQPMLTVIFFCLLTGLTLFGVKVVAKGNSLLMLLMAVSFATLLVMTAPEVKAARYTFIDWAFLPVTLPIMVSAFNFHNIIPTVCHSLECDRAKVRKSILIGTLIGLAMTFAWTVMVMGALPVAGKGSGNILAAFEKGLPATVPLSLVLNSGAFTTICLAFAILAITTSYLASGIALMGFVRDLSETYFGISNRLVESVLTFAPPLVVAVVYPDLFLTALDVVGGMGVALLFGMLPGVLLIKFAKNSGTKTWGWLLLAGFALVLIAEVLQETGMLNINPSTETWKAFLHNPACR